MGKRKRLGFVYLWDKNWLGGKYYAQNLFIALKTLPEEKMPVINLYCTDETLFEEMKAGSGYPYLNKKIIKVSRIKRLFRLVLGFVNRNLSLCINEIDISPNEDVVFPYSRGHKKKRLIYWRPDFQEKYLPENFSETDIRKRDQGIFDVCLRGIPIVFSSFDSERDFRKFFPNYTSHPTFVVHFAVSQPDFSGIDIDEIKEKYGIRKPYLFCANQFWKHKNHLFLFKVFKKMMDRNIDMQLLCTGRIYDNHNPDYIEDLKRYIKENQLEEKIITPGIIEKDEMMCLMKNSYAVVQPSLFEGWNTTIEDCKAMNKFVFLSNLEVHKEQIKENCCFFDPHDEDDLFDKLTTVKPTETYYNYEQDVRLFGAEFYKVMEFVVSNIK